MAVQLAHLLHRYNYLGFTCLDQLALCLISWLAVVCVSDLQSTFSISGQQFLLRTDRAGAQHSTALRCITRHCLAQRIGAEPSTLQVHRPWTPSEALHSGACLKQV